MAVVSDRSPGLAPHDTIHDAVRLATSCHLAGHPVVDGLVRAVHDRRPAPDR